jgi:hypothetical protein
MRSRPLTIILLWAIGPIIIASGSLFGASNSFVLLACGYFGWYIMYMLRFIRRTRRELKVREEAEFRQRILMHIFDIERRQNGSEER